MDRDLPKSREWARKLSEKFGEGVVMGGFPRDEYHGIEPKDVDFYVSLKVFSKKSSNLDLLPEWKMPDDPVYKHQYVAGVLDTEVDGTPVQVVIHANDMRWTDVLDQFDVGLCMIAATPKDAFISGKFDHDTTNKILTVYHNGWGAEGVEAHVARMLKKYPDFTVERVPYNEDYFECA